MELSFLVKTLCDDMCATQAQQVISALQDYNQAQMHDYVSYCKDAEMSPSAIKKSFYRKRSASIMKTIKLHNQAIELLVEHIESSFDLGD